MVLAIAMTAAIVCKPAGARAADRLCDISTAHRPCVTADGLYHARAPAEPEDWSTRRRMPMVVLLHDKGDDAAALIDHPALVQAIVGQGFALIVPAGLTRDFTDGLHSGWYVGNTNTVSGWVLTRWEAKRLYGPFRDEYRKEIRKRDREHITLGRDDLAFLGQVIAHASDRFYLEPRATVVIGVGHGASLAWDAACGSPELAALFAPVNGAFINGYPEDCARPARVVYSHSKSYSAWPLRGARGVDFFGSIPGEDARGRPILLPDTRSFERVDLMSAVGTLEHFAAKHGCAAGEAGPKAADGAVTVRWDRCAIAGSSLAFRLYDDGFEFTEDWIGAVLARSSEAGVPNRTAPRFLKPRSSDASETDRGGAVFLRPKPLSERAADGQASRLP